jgi:hypothetical protein
MQLLYYGRNDYYVATVNEKFTCKNELRDYSQEITCVVTLLYLTEDNTLQPIDEINLITEPRSS